MSFMRAVKSSQFNLCSSTAYILHSTWIECPFIDCDNKMVDHIYYIRTTSVEPRNLATLFIACENSFKIVSLINTKAFLMVRVYLKFN